MKRLKKSLIIGCFFVLALSISLFLSLAIYIGINANNDTKTRSDAILILGAKSYHGHSYNPCLVSRVKHAANLYKAKYAPKIIVSGGLDREDNVSEAETMKKIAITNGVSSNDILLEPLATSTYENLLFTQKVLQSKKLTSVIIVTEPFHIARAALVAQRLGLKYSASPASTSPCWLPWRYFSKYFLKEPFAIILYKVQNKL